MKVLEAVELYRFYHAPSDETLALRGVSLSLDAGETVAVMGPSGSGKSTLLACLAGLDEPDGGHVELMGTRLSRQPEAARAALRAAHLGVLLQSNNLFDHLTVEENIRFQLQLAGRASQTRIDQLLAQVGLSDRRWAYPAELSGGEATRAGLAVATATAPAVLLADEPTGNVDAATERDLLALFDLRRSGGGATVLFTHSQALAQHANRVLRLADGRVAP